MPRSFDSFFALNLKGPCALVLCGKKKMTLLKKKYGTLIPQPLISEKWVSVKFQKICERWKFKYFFQFYYFGICMGAS
jgi:hypothetical protein